MEKLTELLAMGGYAAFVWPSFLTAASVMLGAFILSLRSLKKAQRTLARLQQSALSSSGNEA